MNLARCLADPHDAAGPCVAGPALGLAALAQGQSADEARDSDEIPMSAAAGGEAVNMTGAWLGARGFRFGSKKRGP